MRLNRIKEVLSDKGISQIWLSKKLCKSFCIVNAYAWYRLQPSLDRLSNVGEKLSADMKDFITDNDETN